MLVNQTDHPRWQIDQIRQQADLPAGLLGRRENDLAVALRRRSSMRRPSQMTKAVGDDAGFAILVVDRPFFVAGELRSPLSGLAEPMHEVGAVLSMGGDQIEAENPAIVDVD